MVFLFFFLPFSWILLSLSSEPQLASEGNTKTSSLVFYFPPFPFALSGRFMMSSFHFRRMFQNLRFATVSLCKKAFGRCYEPTFFQAFSLHQTIKQGLFETKLGNVFGIAEFQLFAKTSAIQSNNNYHNLFATLDCRHQVDR